MFASPSFERVWVDLGANFTFTFDPWGCKIDGRVVKEDIGGRLVQIKPALLANACGYLGIVPVDVGVEDIADLLLDGR